MHRLGLPCSLLFAFLTVACSPSPQPATLDELVAEITKARADGDQDRLLELVGTMLPTGADLRQVFTRDGITRQFRRACRYVDAKLDQQAVALLADRLFRPLTEEQSEIRCHCASTEELRQWEIGSLAWREFPAESRRFAQLVNPGLEWWVVEQAAPEEASGHRTAMITKIGSRFVLVPEPWQWLKRL